MKIAIQANSSRGKEIISLLKSLGGINDRNWKGDGTIGDYYIDENNIIRYNYKPIGYKVYTLEEFEKEFPFKIGDEVMFPVKTGWASGKITGLTYVGDQLKYEVDNRIAGYRYIEPRILQLYPMKEERNITLTLDKAKEWYKKGEELREIALQAFTEKELTKVELPRSWEEFCRTHDIMPEETVISGAKSNTSCIGVRIKRDACEDRNVCPSKKSAEAHLAMMQLEQLRNCWRQGWEPDWSDAKQAKCYICYYQGKFKISTLYETRCFLSFPTYEMAKEFLECFRDLIEKAGDLI